MILFLALTVSESKGVINYITVHVYNILTVAVTIAVLSAIIFTYFWFENKELLAKCSRIFEIFLIFGIAAVISTVIGQGARMPIRRRAVVPELWQSIGPAG